MCEKWSNRVNFYFFRIAEASLEFPGFEFRAVVDHMTQQ